jgi:iron(III) transport system ATP-binding protein
MTSLSVSHLFVKFGDRDVISDLSFDLAEGQIASLLGPSGCGKTTLLRAIAGLIQPSGGTIRFGSQLVGVSSVVLPPSKRGTGYVPQQGALFPHLSVAKNIAFGLDREIYSKSEISQITEEMVALIGMQGFEDRAPYQLSGGQQMRVALARALAIKPKLILLDEPFAALDAALRDELRNEVIGLLRKLGSTAILVTHDREEALVSSDRVILMRDGKVAQSGTPEEVYESPQSAEIAASTGDVLTLPADKSSTGAISYPLAAQRFAHSSRPSGYVVIRPEEIKVMKEGGIGREGVLTHIDYYGHDAMLTIDLKDDLLEDLADTSTIIRARVAGPAEFNVGQKVYLEHVGPIRYFSLP